VNTSSGVGLKENKNDKLKTTLRKIKDPSKFLLQISSQVSDMVGIIPNLLDNFEADEKILQSEIDSLTSICANHQILYYFLKQPGAQRKKFATVSL